MTCNKCKTKFPSSIVIDGKRRMLNKRMYCLECSPFGKNNRSMLCGKLKSNSVVNCGVNWNDVNESYKSGLSMKMISDKFNISISRLRSAGKAGLIKFRNKTEAAAMAALNGRSSGARIWTKELRKKQSSNRKKFLSEHPEKHPNRILSGNRSRMSFPEKLASDLLSSNGFVFEHNKKIGKYWVDFLIGTTVIEIDGERWHNKEKDSLRDSDLLSLGYRVVRFPAKLVIKNPSVILQDIRCGA